MEQHPPVAGVPWISDGAWRKGVARAGQEPKTERQLSIAFSQPRFRSVQQVYIKLKWGHEFIFFSLKLFFSAGI